MEQVMEGALPIDQVVRAVIDRGMETPVLFALEMVRPFAGSISIVSEAFAPFLSVFFGPKIFPSLIKILRDPNALGLLIDRLEGDSHG